ncbi:hypothetical protein M8J76_016260 [Diaphorina citri]|nr:hypothetical protein M8J76_016260 [Diaphorina citri]
MDMINKDHPTEFQSTCNTDATQCNPQFDQCNLQADNKMFNSNPQLGQCNLQFNQCNPQVGPCKPHFDQCNSFPDNTMGKCNPRACTSSSQCESRKRLPVDMGNMEMKKIKLEDNAFNCGGSSSIPFNHGEDFQHNALSLNHCGGSTNLPVKHCGNSHHKSNQCGRHYLQHTALPMTHCCEGDFHNALSRNRCGGGRSSSHCSTSLWCPCPCSSNCTAFGDDLGDSSADTGNGDKKDDSDVDEGTLAFLRIFAPDVYEKIQMKRLIKRDIIVERPDVQWSDIANQVKAKKLLQEAVILPLEKPSYFQHIRKPWKGVLMVGPPGTGKTMLAKAVATEKNITFFNISVSTLTSKFFGESEKLIKALFDEAKARAPSVIFIDEIDSLCSIRGEQSEHECTRRMKSELLCHMDGIASTTNSDPTKSIVILGASNFPWNIDDAFLRRLEKRIYVPLPSSSGRQELLRLILRQVDLASDLDLELVSDQLEGIQRIILRQIDLASDLDLELVSDQLEGYSASDIVVVCRDAAFMAMRAAIRGKSVPQIQAIPMAQLKRPVTKADFEMAIAKCRKTVTAADIRQFEEWNEKFGSSV